MAQDWFLALAYFWFKAFHVIGVVVWFAGLFYLVRLFVYHAEAEAKPEPARTILRDQYALMEARLFRIICQPGAVLTVGMGIAMLAVNPTWLSYRWLQVKLGFVVLLIAYHFLCNRWREALAAGTSRFTASQFRLLNELPTVFLVTIVLLAVFKNALPATGAGLVVLALVVLLLAGIRLYARYRGRAGTAV